MYESLITIREKRKKDYKKIRLKRKKIYFLRYIQYMAETRFNSDPCRISKKLQQMTDEGRYRLNVPGNGLKPSYMADPHIILQKWGGNLRTHPVELESALFGVNRSLSRDCLGKDEYKRFSPHTEAISYPESRDLYTEQSRTIAPAWTARDLEQVNWYYLPLNPQENTCLPFQNNTSTRILEKDAFSQMRENEFVNKRIDREMQHNLSYNLRPLPQDTDSK